MSITTSLANTLLDNNNNQPATLKTVPPNKFTAVYPTVYPLFSTVTHPWNVWSPEQLPQVPQSASPINIVLILSLPVEYMEVSHSEDKNNRLVFQALIPDLWAVVYFYDLLTRVLNVFCIF